MQSFKFKIIFLIFYNNLLFYFQLILINFIIEYYNAEVVITHLQIIVFDFNKFY